MQRIPRYILLLQELKKHTSPEHPDSEPVTRAWQQARPVPLVAHLPTNSELTGSPPQMQEVATYVNQRKKESEQLQRVLEVRARLEADLARLELPELVTPGRSFVREDEARLVQEGERRLDKKGRLEKAPLRRLVLFNDLLLVAEARGEGEFGTEPLRLHAEPLHLRRVRLSDPERADDAAAADPQPHVVSLEHYSTGEPFYRFAFASAELKRSWFEEAHQFVEQQETAARIADEQATKKATAKAEEFKRIAGERYSNTAELISLGAVTATATAGEAPSPELLKLERRLLGLDRPLAEPGRELLRQLDCVLQTPTVPPRASAAGSSSSSKRSGKHLFAGDKRQVRTLFLFNDGLLLETEPAGEEGQQLQVRRAFPRLRTAGGARLKARSDGDPIRGDAFDLVEEDTGERVLVGVRGASADQQAHFWHDLQRLCTDLQRIDDARLVRSLPRSDAVKAQIASRYAGEHHQKQVTSHSYSGGATSDPRPAPVAHSSSMPSLGSAASSPALVGASASATAQQAGGEAAPSPGLRKWAIKRGYASQFWSPVTTTTTTSSSSPESSYSVKPERICRQTAAGKSTSGKKYST